MTEWEDLATSALEVYSQLPANAQPAFFEMLLHPAQAGKTLYQMYYDTARNDLYAEQGRTSANQYLLSVFDDINQDANLTITYNKYVKIWYRTI
jgi:hypothetical protein